MNTWLEAYQKGFFSKVELINDTELKGYALVSTGEQSVFFGKKFALENYEVQKTTKSASLSLLDLGVQLTGENLVVMKYQ